MASFPVEIAVPRALAVRVDHDTLSVDLSDGRSIAAPLSWYPCLVHASAAERGNWRLIADGDGIHWPDLDEDVSVSALLTGKPSAESQESLRRWLAARKGLAAPS
jgi:hypothetical protein